MGGEPDLNPLHLELLGKVYGVVPVGPQPTRAAKAKPGRGTRHQRSMKDLSIRTSVQTQSKTAKLSFRHTTSG